MSHEFCFEKNLLSIKKNVFLFKRMLCHHFTYLQVSFSELKIID